MASFSFVSGTAVGQLAVPLLLLTFATLCQAGEWCYPEFGSQFYCSGYCCSRRTQCCGAWFNTPRLIASIVSAIAGFFVLFIVIYLVFRVWRRPARPNTNPPMVPYYGPPPPGAQPYYGVPPPGMPPPGQPPAPYYGDQQFPPQPPAAGTSAVFGYPPGQPNPAVKV